MNTISRYKLVNDIISLYETSPEKIKPVLNYLIDWLVDYYSIDISIQDLINDLKENKFQLEHLINILNNHQDTIYELFKVLKIQMYYSDEINNTIIVLSDRHTFWELWKENEDITFSDEELHFAADRAINNFNVFINNKYNLSLEIVRAWSNGRHIWIILDQNVEQNIIQIYEVLDDIINDYDNAEKDFINSFNG